MGKSIKVVGVSACLMGCPVRYNGASRFFPWVSGGLAHFAVKPVCPEFESGLGVPRPILRLEGNEEHPRIVFPISGEDVTDKLMAWAEKRLLTLKENNIVGFIFKSGSPSCALKPVELVNQAGEEIGQSPGIWTSIFRKAFPQLPVADENELADQPARIKFLRSLLGK